MHGGVKVYRGTAAAARNYVEADRSRADDYYLAEGTGVARRYAAGPDRPVVELSPLSGGGDQSHLADAQLAQRRLDLVADDRAVGALGAGRPAVRRVEPGVGERRRAASPQ